MNRPLKLCQKESCYVTLSKTVHRIAIIEEGTLT